MISQLSCDKPSESEFNLIHRIKSASRFCMKAIKMRCTGLSLDDAHFNDIDVAGLSRHVSEVHGCRIISNLSRSR